MTSLFKALLGVFVLIAVVLILFPFPMRSRHYPRRASCQSSLKLVGLAWQQYAQDYDEKLPTQQWGTLLLPYAKYGAVFNCAETKDVQGTSDYFFNSRFLGKATAGIPSPKSLVLIGDGLADGSLGATLYQLPDSWRKDEHSPAWRHLDGANYGFADGHVKWLKANRVSRNFGMVTP